MSPDSTTTEETISCQLTAMSPPQRERYEELKKQLRAAVQEVEELPNGYGFRYKASPDLVLTAAEFITLESRCCSFYAFHLEIGGNGGPMWLRITGPEAAKAFIYEAIVG